MQPLILSARGGYPTTDEGLFGLECGVERGSGLRSGPARTRWRAGPACGVGRTRVAAAGRHGRGAAFWALMRLWWRTRRWLCPGLCCPVDSFMVQALEAARPTRPATAAADEADHRVQQDTHGCRAAKRVLAPLPTCSTPQTTRLGPTLNQWTDAFLGHLTTSEANKRRHPNSKRPDPTRPPHRQKVPQPRQPPPKNAPHRPRPTPATPRSNPKSQQTFIQRVPMLAQLPR